jgi:hypothetical protein
MEELRQLKIKTGSIKRLRKELLMYQAEEKAERAKVQKLVDGAADAHDIKYAVSFLAIPRWEMIRAACAVLHRETDHLSPLPPDPRRASWRNRRPWCPILGSGWRRRWESCRPCW